MGSIGNDHLKRISIDPFYEIGLLLYQDIKRPLA